MTNSQAENLHGINMLLKHTQELYEAHRTIINEMLNHTKVRNAREHSPDDRSFSMHTKSPPSQIPEFVQVEDILEKSKKILEKFRNKNPDSIFAIKVSDETEPEKPSRKNSVREHAAVPTSIVSHKDYVELRSTVCAVGDATENRLSDLHLTANVCGKPLEKFDLLSKKMERIQKEHEALIFGAKEKFQNTFSHRRLKFLRHVRSAYHIKTEPDDFEKSRDENLATAELLSYRNIGDVKEMYRTLNCICWLEILIQVCRILKSTIIPALLETDSKERKRGRIVDFCSNILNEQLAPLIKYQHSSCTT